VLGLAIRVPHERILDILLMMLPSRMNWSRRTSNPFSIRSLLVPAAFLPGRDVAELKLICGLSKNASPRAMKSRCHIPALMSAPFASGACGGPHPSAPRRSSPPHRTVGGCFVSSLTPFLFSSCTCALSSSTLRLRRAR